MRKEEEKLNTMKSFKEEGFKIERDGKVITLDFDEMFDFIYLQKANEGRRSLLEYKATASLEDARIIRKFENDEEVCFNIADAIEFKHMAVLNNIQYKGLANIQELEKSVCRKFIELQKEKEKENE